MAQYVKSPKCRALWTYNCYEADKIKDRHGQEIVQQPPVYFKGEKYTESFEHAFVHILYTPKLFKAYNKCSLILRGVEIVELADSDYVSPDEHDVAVLKQLGALNGEA